MHPLLSGQLAWEWTGGREAGPKTWWFSVPRSTDIFAAVFALIFMAPWALVPGLAASPV